MILPLRMSACDHISVCTYAPYVDIRSSAAGSQALGECQPFYLLFCGTASVNNNATPPTQRIWVEPPIQTGIFEDRPANVNVRAGISACKMVECADICDFESR